MRSPRIARALALGLLATGGRTMPAGAQDARELARRVDEAMALRARVAVRYVQLQGRRAAPRVYPDTVVALGGALRVVTSAEFVPVVRDAAARAEAFLRRRAGDAAPRLTPIVLAVWTDSIRRREHGLIVASRVDGHDLEGANIVADAPSIARVAEAIFQAQVGTDRLPAFAAWLQGSLPLDDATAREWRALRLELVSTRATIAHRCFAGDIAACEATLGLAPAADPATAWYDAAARRAVVADARASARLDAPAAAACVAGSDATCLALLRTSEALAGATLPPGSRGARIALVQEAIAAGGPGALARLATSADSPAAALEAMGGLPLDALVRRWQRRARTGGAESESATPLVALTAVGWILILGGVSLGSPRWR